MGLVLGHDAVRDNFFLHDVFEEGSELLAVVVGVGAGGLDQAVEGVLIGERKGFAGGADVEVLALIVHELEGRQDLGELALGFAEGFLDVLVRGKTKVGDVDGGRALRAVDRNTSDHTNSALATDEELLEIVAGVVLAELGQIVENGAVRKDGFKTKNSAVERAVTKKTKTTGVSGDVAANVA